jgi:hypothetical protein
MLSELWRLMQYLLRPEKAGDPGFSRGGQDSALAGLAKTLLWAGLAMLAGFGLAQLK